MKDHLLNPFGFYDEAACDLTEFEELIARQLSPDEVPHAKGIEARIPIYDAPALSHVWEDGSARRALMAEWAWVLHSGPGVIAIRQAQTDHAAIDAATDVYAQIIAEEKAAGASGADHFAGEGKNDRIWNSLQKLCLRAPETFIRYHASPAMDTVSEAWLGPNYQMTAQINLVRPGGQAQEAHRDYHLGFQTAEVSATYPSHVHDLSPLMTLQGGLAHVDMSVESGPTKLLPYSQLYRPGYAAWRRQDFRDTFEAAYVQLALAKGDAVFFSPALFHAAGENRSADVERMVNLFQVSSAFGRAMENVDRVAMCEALYEPLDRAGLAPASRRAVIGASAEGYPFPSNLDTDPPTGGLAPESQAALLARALDEGMSKSDFVAALAAQAARKLA